MWLVVLQQPSLRQPFLKNLIRFLTLSFLVVDVSVEHFPPSTFCKVRLSAQPQTLPSSSSASPPGASASGTTPIELLQLLAVGLSKNKQTNKQEHMRIGTINTSNHYI